MTKSSFSFDTPEKSPGFLLWQVSITWQRQIKVELDPHGISHAQFVILAVLLWCEETKNKPIQSVVERCIQLRGCKFVDEIIPYITEKDLEDVLLSLPIDVRILGIEYKDKKFTGQEFCKSRGIKFYFNKRDHKFSSSELRKRMVEKHIKSRVNELCGAEEEGETWR